MLKPSAHGFLISDLRFPISDLRFSFPLSERRADAERALKRPPGSILQILPISELGPSISGFGLRISDLRPPISASGLQPSAFGLPIMEFLQN